MSSVDKLGTVESPDEMIRYAATFGIDTVVLFRGQREAWPLLPKIGRPFIGRDKSASIPDLERKMLSEFRWRALPHAQRNMGDNLWEWLALAQHYGMPTRLLDWTTNPLAALWFAVRKPTDSKKPGVVWLFVPDEEDRLGPGTRESPFDRKVTRVFRPAHITPRIIVQSGWFTVHRWIPEKKRFIPLETNTRYKEKIFRIDIPTDSFATIRRTVCPP